MPTQKMLVFLENPYDLQSILDCLKIAKNHNKELIYLDRVIATLRLDPEGDVVNISYRTMIDLGLIKIETEKN
jgi:hypothetical protein